MIGRKRQLADLLDAPDQLALPLRLELMNLRHARGLTFGEQRVRRYEDLRGLDLVTAEHARHALRRNERMAAQRDARHGDAKEIVQGAELRVVSDFGRAADEDVG